jgi:hypothetical protein
MKLYSFAAAGLFCAAASQLAAQTPTDPPAVLRIIREDIKEGRETAHRNNENSFMLEAATAHYPAHILGMSSLTGTGQAWFLEGHDSFEAVEKTLAAYGTPDSKFAQIDELDAEFRSGSRSWLAMYRPDLSYLPEQWVQSLPKARFMNIDIFRIQPGHDADFAELGHMHVDAARKAVSDQPVVAYEIVSGMPAGTYLLFQPTASLKTLDTDTDRSNAMMRAMGDTAATRFVKGVRDTIVSDELLLFSIEPRMSYVPKEFIDADPDFWSQKAEPAPKPKPHGKAAPKPSGN